MSAVLHLADCREVMRALPENSVHAIVTDPPYEIGFMGHGWDSGGIAFDREVWREALRVLVPGGHVLASGATRTWHWLAVAIELAGFEPRDSIAWIQGQGMPHGKSIGKAIDAAAGAEREVLGVGGAQCHYIERGEPCRGHNNGERSQSGLTIHSPATAPATPEAATWEGWNTTLAPAHEPIVVMRKPLSERTVEANVLRWGAGALHVDACRLKGGKQVPASVSRNPSGRVALGQRGRETGKESGHDPTVGRWPPNVALDEAAARELDALVGRRVGRGNARPEPLPATPMFSGVRHGGSGRADVTRQNPQRGAPMPSAFFYCPKAPTGERDRGCEHLRWKRCKAQGWRPCEPGEEPDLVGNPHPTVKPLALMRWLLRLVTPTAAHLPGGGLVLDPFLGSGTTGVAAVCEGVRFVGSDVTAWAHAVATARVRWAQGLGPAVDDPANGGAPVQGSLFA